MSDLDTNTGTTYAGLDWDQYTKARPRYPTSLKKLIFDYHQAKGHNAVGGRLVDLGSGNGIASVSFLSDFDTINLLDPSPSNQEQAKGFLEACIEQGKLQTKLESTLSTIETAPDTLNSCADMVICATVAHFIDPQSLVQSVARILRPGGTMAIYGYLFPTFPDQSKSFNKAFYKAVIHNLSLCARDEKTKSVFSKVAGRLTAGNGILDSVPIPEADFEHPQRVYINQASGATGSAMFKAGFFTTVEETENQVNDREPKLSYEAGRDAEAEGWSFSASQEWLKKFMATMRPGNIPAGEAEDPNVYGDWDKAFAEECPSGEARTVWPVCILLASRRRV